MASKKRSSAVRLPGHTILDASIRIMALTGNNGKSPRQIADFGIEKNILRIPRGRTAGYLNQLVQSSLYNSVLSAEPQVYRTATGRYKAKNSAVKAFG